MTEDPSDEASDRARGDAFVDRRTDYEKLVELLALGEGTRLDFKRQLDLDSRLAQLNFAKDVVAMSNTPPGGYIVIGVEDDGRPCLPTGTLDRSRFDPARLGDAVRRFIDGRIEILVAIHDHNGCEIVLIYVAPHRDGLPVPMNQTGNHPDPRNDRKQVVVSREGEVPVREGAANVPLRHSHWSLILSAFEQQIRSQATETTQAMLREFLDERNQSRAESPAGIAEVPLLLGMEESAFAAVAHAGDFSGVLGQACVDRVLDVEHRLQVHQRRLGVVAGGDAHEPTDLHARPIGKFGPVVFAAAHATATTRRSHVRPARSSSRVTFVGQCLDGVHDGSGNLLGGGVFGVDDVGLVVQPGPSASAYTGRWTRRNDEGPISRSPSMRLRSVSWSA